MSKSLERKGLNDLREMPEGLDRGQGNARRGDTQKT